MRSDLLALTVGPANCEAVTGLPWRHVRDHAEELGLEFVSVGAKRVLLADRLLAALEKRTTTPTVPEDDELERARREIAEAH